MREAVTRWSRRLPPRPRLVAQTLVLASVVAGTAGFTAAHKSVTLDVDGDVSTVSVFGTTVDDVLRANDVEVVEADLVVPAADAPLQDGTTVVVRHGREVTVVLDGEERRVWTTGTTVGEVLAQLGVRGEYRASASRSATLGRQPVHVATDKVVHVAVDGATRTVRTTAATVRDVLAQAEVVLGAYDRVSVALDTEAVDGLTVLVTRVDTQTRSREVVTKFETVRKETDDLPKGTEVVASEGRDGRSVVSYVAQLVGGVEVGRTVLAEAVLVPAVDRVVRVGTSDAPDPGGVDPVTPGTARAIALEMVLERGWDETQFVCLDKLWMKESGWRVDAENPSSGAYGIPQALPGTKMASAGDDWRTNPRTQIEWGLGYIDGRYGDPCGAWAHSQAVGWY